MEHTDRVLDLGCGYGHSSVFSQEVWMQRGWILANARALEAGLQDLLTFESGDFHILRYEIMAEIANLEEGSRVLDLGCGYGATARYLARKCGCSVAGINVSEKELEVANARALEAGLQDLLTFESGDFHILRYEDESFEVV